MEDSWKQLELEMSGCMSTIHEATLTLVKFCKQADFNKAD
jgi:hypothetical protein